MRVDLRTVSKTPLVRWNQGAMEKEVKFWMVSCGLSLLLILSRAHPMRAWKVQVLPAPHAAG